MKDTNILYGLDPLFTKAAFALIKGSSNYHNEILNNIPTQVDEFRNNFFKQLEEERVKKDYILKRLQKNCLHKYTKITKYNTKFSIASCEKCKHNKFTNT